MALLALHSASTGLSALTTELDVIANNLANVNTDGFKVSRVNFQTLLYEEKAQPGVENINGDQRPTGIYVGLGVEISGTQLDFKQGPAAQVVRHRALGRRALHGRVEHREGARRVAGGHQLRHVGGEQQLILRVGPIGAALGEQRRRPSRPVLPGRKGCPLLLSVQCAWIGYK